MSFFEVASYLINPRFTLYMNDIMFIMVVCFYVGRLYERNRMAKYIFIDTEKLGIQSMNTFTATPSFLSRSSKPEYQQDLQGLSQDGLIKKEKQQLHGSHQVSLQKSLPKLVLQKELVSQAKDNEENLVTSLQVFDSQKLSNSRFVQINQQQAEPNYQENNQLLVERIKLEGQKIQENGKIYINFEFSKENSNFIRKIEKHEIITDYIVKKQSLASHHGQFQLVPLKKQLAYPNQNSAIEVQYYQNYNGGKKNEPIIQKRIIQLNQKSQMYVNSFIQHGKFRKLYRNIVKIGEGGFGTVYQAYHLLQSKKYAVKKIFINKMSKQIQNLLNQIKILNSLSHPNVVKYNSCWLEYAEFNQHKQYQVLLQRYEKNSNNRTSLQIIGDQNDDQQNLNSSQFEQSYISDGSNGFSFARSSKQVTKKSISQLKKKQSGKLIKKQDVKVSQGQKQNNFGFLPVMYIQMELCEHSLAYYLKRRQQIDRIFCYEIMAQLIQGVSYIHMNRIVHRDLKPENILFAANAETLAVKIGDFGLAVQMQGKGQQKNLMISNTPAGTPSYIAPQLYSTSIKKLNEDDLQKTDIYSLAVIYYEMLNKFSTSHERGEKLSSLKFGKVPGITEFKQEKKLIQQLIKHNRPSAKQILQTQNWKKLSQTIHKLKRKLYKNYCISKKDSYSTNHTSNYSQQSQNKILYFDENIKKQTSMSKSKVRTNKNKFRESYDIKKGLDQDQQLIDSYQCQIQSSRNKQSDSFECNNEEIEHELYRQNILIIRRTNSWVRKNEGHDGHIIEEDGNSNSNHTHPEIEREANNSQ